MALAASPAPLDPFDKKKSCEKTKNTGDETQLKGSGPAEWIWPCHNKQWKFVKMRRILAREEEKKPLGRSGLALPL